MRALLLAWRAFGIGAHPLQLLLHRLDARGLLLRLGLQPLLLLLQPRAVVAFPRNAVAAVELEYPLGRVVEEIAIVRHRHHGARKFLQELLEPIDAFGIEVVGRLVEQQHVGLGQQQPAQRDAALLAARQIRDLGVPRRQAQRVGRDLRADARRRCRWRPESLRTWPDRRRACRSPHRARRRRRRSRRAWLSLPSLRPGPAPPPRARVCSGSSCGSCGRKPMRMLGIGTASPSMSVSSPAMILSRLDLPEPFSPSTPILAPGKKDSEMSLRMTRLGGTTLPTRCMV